MESSRLVSFNVLLQIRDTKNTIGSVRSIKNNARNRHTEHIDGRLLVDSAGKGNLMLLRRDVEG